jgi:hypothetical protein
LSREPGVADSPKNSRRQFNPAPMAWPRPEAMPVPLLNPVRPEPGPALPVGVAHCSHSSFSVGGGRVHYGGRDEELTRCGRTP